MKRFIVIILATQAGQALAQTADCDRIKNSDVPYVIIQELSTFEMSGKSTKEAPRTKSMTEIYREDTEYVVGYSYIDDGSPFKSILKNGFTYKSELRSKNSYMISTSQHATAFTKDPRLERKPFQFEATLTTKKSRTPDEVTKIISNGSYVAQDKLSIGQCSLNVHIYKIHTKRQVIDGEPEIQWATAYYSPELKFNLRTEVEYLDIDNKPRMKMIVQPVQLNPVSKPDRDQSAIRILDDVCFRTNPAQMTDKMAAYQAKQQGPELNQKFFRPQQGTSWTFSSNNREYTAGWTDKGACVLFVFDGSGRRIKDYLTSDYGIKFINSQVSGKETRHVAELKLPRPAQITAGAIVLDEINDYSLGGARISVVPSSLMGK